MSYIQPGRDPIEDGFNDVDIFSYDDELIETLAAATAEEVVMTSDSDNDSSSSSTSAMSLTDHSDADSEETLGPIN